MITISQGRIRTLSELAIITAGAIAIVKILNAALPTMWFAAPAVLVVAALVPTAVRRQKAADIGMALGSIDHSLWMLLLACVVLLPTALLALWIFTRTGINLPLQPAMVPPQKLLPWLLYQFLYVAVAEELFFRGYLQGSLLKILPAGAQHRWLRHWPTIVTSAAVFAAAHVVIHGQFILILAFLPGLVLGWLFIQTRSLLAPVLFHAIANTWYALVLSTLL